MTKLDKVATNQNCKFEGGVVVFFVTLRKQLAENANKCCHVFKVIVVLHIYGKSLSIRLAGHPATKQKCLGLILRSISSHCDSRTTIYSVN